jgi:hypothetical protein
MEVTVNKHSFRKLATVGAAAALSLQLVAGVASAAVPAGDASVATAYDFAGGGNAGFSTQFTFNGNNLSKLFLSAPITGGAAVPVLLVSKNGNASNACSVQASPLAVNCSFGQTRRGDQFIVQFAVTPAAGASTVTTTPGWTSTGDVTGGNNSHGDLWTPGKLTAAGSASPDLSAGFGNLTLSTKPDFGSNKQYAKLLNLPAGKYAKVNDNAGANGDFPIIELTVNNGALANFQLVVTYPKGTKAPTYFEHTSTGYVTTKYYACANNAPKLNCFDWNKSTATATIYLAHNGTLRRSG